MISSDSRPTVTDAGLQLNADLSRVALKLFLPGEDGRNSTTRLQAVRQLILDLPDDQVDVAATRIVEQFSGGVEHLTRVLQSHADAVSPDSGSPNTEESSDLRSSLKTLVGATFTAEYAVEGAALCNPSAVPHPDQAGLEAGQLRVAVALRAIGEGHISSIEFVSAVIGPGQTWTFGERHMPLVHASIESSVWNRDHFILALNDRVGEQDSELADALTRALPATFSLADFDHAVASLPSTTVKGHDVAAHLTFLRTMVESGYRAVFPKDSDLSQRILMPEEGAEVRGMEDARFVLCTHPDGTFEYRATYTAYDGTNVTPRLIVSQDLVTFDIHTLSGPAATNKGMALFPRHVNGQLLSLTRSDGKTLGIAHSQHGRAWSAPQPLHRPTQLWEVVQTGNCGSPLETEYGWIVLTHGVGPMREYCLGAILLDLEDPSTVIASLDEPLLDPAQSREGYVPNVVYSCGGVIHEGTLWIPYGLGDNRIRVASVDVQDLVNSMTLTPATPVALP